MPSSLRLLIALLILVGVVKACAPQLKGRFGEFVVNAFLRLGLPSSEYRVLSNLMLPTSGGTTQIDHVVVSRYGIFVIETKCYKGWIYGGEHDAQWTQVIFRSKHLFQNPLRQNYKHTRTLCELTDIPEGIFRSVVVFVGDNELKAPKPPNVVRPMKLVPYIRGHRTVLVKDSQIPDIVQVIGEWSRTVNRWQRFCHVRNVKAAHASVALTAAANATVPLCPRCGSKMVSRTNKLDGSRFWGCSGYPSCRGTRRIV